MTLHGTGCERCGSNTGATGCTYTEDGMWVCDDCAYDIECDQREQEDHDSGLDDYDVSTGNEERA